MSLTGHYNARTALSSIGRHLGDHEIISNVTLLAKTAKGLTLSTDQFEAERILAFYLRPDLASNDFQENVFNAWKDLIRKLDQSDYAHSVPLIAAMSAKFEYVPLEDPRSDEFRSFRREIAAPHDAARAQAMLQFGD